MQATIARAFDFRLADISAQLRACAYASVTCPTRLGREEPLSPSIGPFSPASFVCFRRVCAQRPPPGRARFVYGGRSSERRCCVSHRTHFRGVRSMPAAVAFSFLRPPRAFTCSEPPSSPSPLASGRRTAQPAVPAEQGDSRSNVVFGDGIFSARALVSAP